MWGHLCPRVTDVRHKGNQVQSINYFCTQVIQFMNSSPALYCAIQLKKQKQKFGAADVDMLIYTTYRVEEL